VRFFGAGEVAAGWVTFLGRTFAQRVLAASAIRRLPSALMVRLPVGRVLAAMFARGLEVL
jgi:hypothetical protein